MFFLIVGRLSDIFGRRWFFIVGSIIGLVGNIIAATAHSVNALIGAEVLIGIASGFQISFFWVIGELVPMKWRYIASSYCYAMTIPTNPLAAKIAITIQNNTSVGWRACFYIWHCAQCGFGTVLVLLLPSVSMLQHVSST